MNQEARTVPQLAEDGLAPQAKNETAAAVGIASPNPTRLPVYSGNDERLRSRPKKPADSVTVITELMMPNQVNDLGNVSGGEVVARVDRAAAVAAIRHAGRPCVTVSIDHVDFREPIRSGELVTCSARVNYVGTTSLEVGVRVDGENPLTGVKRHTNTCLLTFVAIDEAHRPTPVPPLDLTDPEDRRRYEEGRERRRRRLKLT